MYEFLGGHIGVFVGSRSQKELAPAIAKWLIERDATRSVFAKETPKRTTPAAAAKQAVAKPTKAKATAVKKPKTVSNVVPDVFRTPFKKKSTNR